MTAARGSPASWALLLAATLLLTACDDATAPDLDRLPITTPAVYSTWWNEMRSCSGLDGSPRGVSWFVAYEFPQAPTVLGQWNSRREITLRSDVWLERDVVAHEILHDLLRGDLNHRDPVWQTCDIPVGVDGG